jgi:glucose/arabinose dehydrogenase
VRVAGRLGHHGRSAEDLVLLGSHPRGGNAMQAAQAPSRTRHHRPLTFAVVLVAVIALLGGAAPAPSRAAITLGLVTVASGLAKPVALANAGDGSGRLFVVEQEGRIRMITRSGALVGTPFLDIHGRVSCCGEQGLLGLAFHPSYKSNGRFYVSYTDADGALVVGEHRRTSTNANRASSTERRIIRIPHPGYGNHNGGQIAFGPDGYLYIGTGDGGGGGDPDENGQSRRTLLGKILRIAPNVTSATPAYRIPSTNPWARSTTIRREIWAYGLRNPWRFSFDRSTGSLWIADVGQSEYEEINRASRSAGGGRGANFGWDQYEAYQCFEGPCTSTGKTFPLAAYAHGLNGCSVTGGYVYRGTRHPALAGRYLFGDYCSGRIWSVTAGGSARQKPVLLRDTTMNISAFGEGENRELFVLDYGSGRVRRISAS